MYLNKSLRLIPCSKTGVVKTEVIAMIQGHCLTSLGEMRNDEFITKKISVLLHLTGNVPAARKVIRSLGRSEF